MRPAYPWLPAMVAVLLPAAARAQAERRVTFDEVLRETRRAAPDLLVARARESVARAEVGVAGVYPNPSAAIGTSTEAAKLSGTLSIPLVLFGQRGAAIDAASADATTASLDTKVAWSSVRLAAARAYVGLWLAQGVTSARREAASIATTLEGAVVKRVEVGSAPELDALRVHAEKMRADADVVEAEAEVAVAGNQLARWMGAGDGDALRADSDPDAPEVAPPLESLLSRLGDSAAVLRERSDVRAAEARAAHERALIRPNLSLDLGADAFDATLLPANAAAGAAPPVNYRAQLTVDLPFFNQRGPFIDREMAQADLAGARFQSARVQAAAELTAAYRTFEAATRRRRVLLDGVVPASEKATKALESAYALGQVPLVAVLDAERVLVDERVSAVQSQAARANAWADVDHALGSP